MSHDWGNMEEGVFRVINVSLPFGSVLIEAPLVS
jgi:NhaC family Na+:H+ antiporter